MADDRSTASSPERARMSSWGGPEARAELRRLADDARGRAGFEVGACEVLRGDGFLELVAFVGAPEDRTLIGGSFSLATARRVLREGRRYGPFVFLGEEDMAPDLQERIRGYGYIPPVPETDDPTSWHSLDMLVADVTDRTGRTRMLFHLDEPTDGKRPTPERLTEIGDELELLLQSMLTTVDREELSRHAWLDETAREVVRAASQRLDRPALLEQVQPRLVAGFRATSVQVHLNDEPPPDGPYALPESLRAALDAATLRAWETRTVIIAEPGHVWGDDDLELDHVAETDAYLAAHRAQELLTVPIGAGHEPMGMLVVLRDGGDRWTESESSSALGVGHDLGRALLSTRAHERERQLITELQRLDEYRRQLIATVAHELKNPLGVIAGHVEMLDSMPGMPEAAAPSLRALHRGTARLDTLVQDLLLLSRVGNPDTPLEQTPVDLAALLQEVTEDEALLADQHHVTIVPPTYVGHLVVPGDAEELHRLLVNLVGNAVKYSHEGGRVDLALRQHADVVVFTCADQGIGIAEEEQAQLFTEFFRADDPQARARPGTGLGLAIVGRIVARHGGTIQIESALGRGTTCTVTLPGGPATTNGTE